MKILLADDHDLLRDVLKAYLESLDLQIVVQDTRTLDEAVSLASSEETFDLILLDVDMPGMNGLSGLVRMREKAPQSPVAILSGLNENSIIIEALQKGAAGFIPKSMGARAMVSVIQLILNGERYIPSSLIHEVHAGLETEDDEEQSKSAKVCLTNEEEIVLKRLKDGASNKEIARELGVEEYTVKYYMRGLFKKLGAKNRTHAVTIGTERP